MIRTFTAEKKKFSIKDFFNKYDHIRSFLRIWSNLLKNSFPPFLQAARIAIGIISETFKYWVAVDSRAVSSQEKLVHH